MRLTADRRERLDRFLARQLPEFTRSRLSALIESGAVSVAGKEAKPGLMLKPGFEIEVEPPEAREPHDLTPFRMELNVLFEDAELMVIDKPRGLATHPAPNLNAPSLVNVLLAREGSLSPGSAHYRPGIVHRLDRETTGLIVVAKTERAHHALAKQFAAKTAQRLYVAVLTGDLDSERLSVEAPLARDRTNRFLMAVDPNGKPAVTHFLRLARIDAGTLVAARLETGRTHQIRAHAKAIGHPVVGDRLYPRIDKANGPMQLHAAFLSFTHPTSGEKMAFSTPPPEDFLGRDLFDRDALEQV